MVVASIQKNTSGEPRLAFLSCANDSHIAGLRLQMHGGLIRPFGKGDATTDFL